MPFRPFLATLPLAATALIAAPECAHASPIEYTFSFVGGGVGVGNGQGTAYASANIVVSLFGDTNNITHSVGLGYDVYDASPLTSTVSFNGTSYTLDANDLSESSGFFHIQNSQDDESDVFAAPPSYQFGYTNGPVILAAAALDLIYSSDSDNTHFSNDGDITFNAFNPVAATPEPSSIALLGTGLLGLIGTLKRRRT